MTRVFSIIVGLLVLLPLADAQNVRVRSDENGSLIVVSSPQGAMGGVQDFLSLPLLVSANGYLSVTSDTTPGSLATPFTALANLRGKVDANRALCVSIMTEGSKATPLTPLANLMTKTDENNCLLVGVVAVGATLGPLTSFANARGKTDENGYLLIAEGP